MDLYAEIGGVKVGTHHPTRVMGVINVSPESFFKSSVFSSKLALQKAANQMIQDGADIIDIGARSTAPYLETDISEEEETERLAKAVQFIRDVTDKPISVDTQTAKVAAQALKAGASILNDISGLAHDPAMAQVAAQYNGVILMANAEYTEATGEPITVVGTALKKSLKLAQQAGISSEKIVIDPGIGFFRNSKIPWDDWDRIILRQLPQLYHLGKPLAIGISRKSFIGKVLGHTDPIDRLYGSLGLTALLVNNGAHVIRTHDVASTLDVIKIAEWLYASS